MVVGIFGTLKAGGVFVGISPETKAAKLKYIVQDLGPFALIARQNPGEWLSEIIIELPSLRLVVLTAGACPGADGTMGIIWKGFSELTEESQVQPPSRVNVDLDLACLIYTSGTTGEPKGVMCDHSNVVFVTESIVEYLKNEENDIILSVLPLAFSYGLYQMFATFRSQATLVLEPSFAYPAVVLQRLQEEHVTGFAGTPTIFAMLLQFDAASFDLSSLRYLTNAAAGLPVEHLRRAAGSFSQG